MYSLQRKINRIGIFGENEGCVIEFPIVPLHAEKRVYEKIAYDRKLLTEHLSVK